MFKKIASFEFWYQLKSPVFLVVAVLFFLLSFGNITSDNVQLAAVGNVNINSPDAIFQVHLIMSLIALFAVTAFLASIILRDSEYKSAEILYTTQVNKRDYLLGRFSGAYLVALASFVAVTLGMIVGSFMPGLDPERLGAFQLGDYLYAVLVIGIPNLLFAGAFAFATATLTRSLLLTYVAIVAFMMLYGVSQNFLGEPELRNMAALFDPFGAAAYTEVTRYWTAFERNDNLIPLHGLFLYNRLLWLSISLALIGLTYWRFRFQTVSGRRGKKKDTAPASALAAVRPINLPRYSSSEDALTPWRQFTARVWFETKSVVKSVPFLILVGLAVFVTYLNFTNLNQIFGTPVYPVTRVLTNILQGTFTLSLIIVVIYYGAELVWRERQTGIHEIIDSTPTPNWAFVASKVLALLLVVAILLAFGVLTSVFYQFTQGHGRFEWGVYLTRHMLDYGSIFYFSAILSIFLQTLVRNKFVGMALMVAYVVIVLFTLDSLGYEDPLYQFGTRADIAYSDMNGWGHFAAIAWWYAMYWLMFCGLLFIAAYLLWRRGAVESLWQRLKKAPALMTPATRHWTLALLLLFMAIGSYIFYNTHILNPYVTQRDIENQQVLYEQRYEKYEGVAQPRIVDIKTEVDIYPYDLRYEARGQYQLENKTQESISEVLVGVNPAITVSRMELEGATLREHDDAFNFYIFDLAEPLAPGGRLSLSFTSGRDVQGFRHARNSTPALGQATMSYNGTFIFDNDAFPYIGYSKGQIITDRNTRRRHELPPIDRFADLDDAASYGNSYLRQDSDWISFEATVSTADDQVAIAPGYLQREWQQDGRRYFHYAMDAPMQNLFAFISADYERQHEVWNDIDIEVYYHPTHQYNVEKMMDSVKKSIDYFTRNFSPYQYRQMRILEFPSFAGNFAVSFPNTVPWSEGLGFIARVEEESDIDYVFYVGAHEVAHQWWGHQVSSANVQGQTMLVETLAQYSALMVMEEEYGPHLMRRFLKYELDNYLTNRGNEAKAEMPLYRVENQQYIHYRKGSIVMYALKDYLGGERVNQALAQFVSRYAYRHDPYPTSRDLLAEFKAVARDDQELALIEDLFERITLWDLRVTEATVSEREDGLFQVAMTIDADKLVADGEGRERSVGLNMPIDIGIFGASPESDEFGEEQVIQLEKQWVQSGQSTLHFTVAQRPTHVGIDPYNKLIDRNAEDNLKAISN